MLLPTARIDIRYLHAGVYQQPLTQQAAQHPCNLSANRRFPRIGHSFTGADRIADCPYAAKQSRRRRAQHPFLRIAADSARDPCVGSSRALHDNPAQIMASVGFDHGMHILLCSEPWTYADDKFRLLFICTGISFCQGRIHQRPRAQGTPQCPFLIDYHWNNASCSYRRRLRSAAQNSFDTLYRAASFIYSLRKSHRPPNDSRLGQLADHYGKTAAKQAVGDAAGQIAAAFYQYQFFHCLSPNCAKAKNNGLNKSRGSHGGFD